MAEGPDPFLRPFAQLKEQVNCPVCLEIFKKPKTLICTHAFCMDCIDKLPLDLVDGEYKIYCPTCREPTTLPRNSSAASLRPAFLVNTLIELYHSMDVPIPAVSKPKPVEGNMCQEHNRPLEMYCNECQQLACSKCDRLNHHDHNCSYIADVFGRHREEINDHLQLVARQTHVVLDALHNLNAQQEAIIGQGEAIKNEINEITAQLVQAIQQSGAQLRESVDALVEQKLVNITAQIKEGQILLTSLKSCEQYVHDRLCKGSQQEILLEKRRLIERLTEASQELTIEQLELKEKADMVFQRSHDILERCNKIGEVGVENVRDDMAALLESSMISSSTATDVPATDIRKPHYIVAMEGRPSDIFIYIPTISSLKQRHLRCHLAADVGGVATPCEIKQVGKARYRVSFTAQNQGLHRVKLQFKGVDIPIPCTVQIAAAITGLRCPSGIATTGGGLLVATEDAGVATIDKDTHAINRSNTNGGGSNQGICHTLDNCILVVSSRAPHLTKYTMDLTLVSTVNTSHGSGPLQFKNPHGIAASNDGHIYVCDTNNHRIQVLNPDLTFSHAFGTKGSGHGQFCNPHGVAVDPHDNMVYVCDHDNKRIQKLSGDGTYISEFKVMSRPRCLATDGTMLYVTTRDSMIIYNSNGEAIHEKPSLKAGGCMGVAVDEGHAYICNFDDNHIVII